MGRMLRLRHHRRGKLHGGGRGRHIHDGRMRKHLYHAARRRRREKPGLLLRWRMRYDARMLRLQNYRCGNVRGGGRYLARRRVWRHLFGLMQMHHRTTLVSSQDIFVYTYIYVTRVYGSTLQYKNRFRFMSFYLCAEPTYKQRPTV